MVIDNPNAFKLDEIEPSEKLLDQTVVVQSNSKGLMNSISDLKPQQTTDTESQND